MADACGRCGGKGWRWTGQARVSCTCPGAVPAPRDPNVADNVDLVQVDDWTGFGLPHEGMRARITRRWRAR